MSYPSKLKQNRLLCIFFLMIFFVIAVNINFQREDYGSEQIDNPSLSTAPLYHQEWSVVNPSIGYCYDLAMGSGEDIYMVGDGGSVKSTVVKYDKNGNLIWQQTQDGECYDIALDSSNNVYIAGRTDDWKMILIKFSSSGVFQWSKTYSPRDYDIAYAVTVDSSNNVYIGGESYVSGSWVNKDALLVKYSSSGTFIWERYLDLRDEDYIKALTTDSSNNIYLTGHHRLYSTPDDVFIAKYSSSGVFQWSKNWGSGYDEEAYAITLDSANNIYVTGFANDPTTHEDLLLLKFNSAGNLQWTREWVGYGLDRGYSVDVSSDGDIFIGGATYEESVGLFDVLLMVYNSAGSVKWWGHWGTGDHDVGRGIAVTTSKQVYLGGDRNDDLWLLKFEFAPSITINSPSPDSLYSFSAPSFDVDITDSNLVEKYYTLNDGSHYVFTGSTGTINQAAWDACPHGDVSLKFYGRDSSGAVFEEVVVRKDIMAPDFEIISPTTFQICTDTAPNYQLTTGDTDVDGIWYTLNGGGNIVVSSLTGVINQAAWDALDNGSVLIEFFLEDDIGNIASKSVEVYKNYEIPLISIYSPLPNQFCGIKTVNYNIATFSLWAVDDMWYSLNSGQNITITEMDGTINQMYWDSCGNGTVTITFYANNTLGNIGSAEVAVRKDMYYPFLDIYSPIVSQKYGISPPNYNVSITSVALDSKWYTLNYGDEIYFLDDESTIDKPAWNACPNGSVVITFYANNTGGIINSKEVLIFKDVRRPDITILSPSIEGFYGLETIGFNLSIDDPQLDKMWYSLNGGVNFSFIGTSGNIDQGYWDLCGNGTVTIRFYANNSLGNVGTAEITVRKDVYFPFITILSPDSEKLCGISAPNYNIIVSSIDVDSMWYSLNDGINFTILSTVGTIDQLYWDNFGNENVTITFYSNDSYGRINSVSVKVRKDMRLPNITIFSPQPFELFGIETISFNVSITDPTLDSTWFTLNGGAKIFFTGNYGIIDQIAWDACGNGTVSIVFYGNNSLGNIVYVEVTVHRDIYYPFIWIHEPINNQLTGPLAPNFNISVSSSAIDSMWYVLNYSTIGFFLETDGIIDQSKWDLFGAGSITISFYANNTYGQFNFKEIVVEKAMEVIERTAYAIVIGVSDYPGSTSDLSYCDDDAIAVYNMLIEDYNFKPENIILLQDSSATKNGINNAFDTIISQIKPDDIFYFYYSGHGGSELVTSSPSTLYIQSPHPYPNYYDRTWWISSTDAAYIRVHFETLDLESGYDVLYLGDAEIDYFYYQELTGYATDFWSDWIPVLNDNRLYINLMTDYSVTAWGFRIDQIQVMRYSDPHYLCPYDSIPSSPGNYYLDTLIDSKLDSVNCDNKYLIMDSCNSGGIIPEVQDSNRFVMTACKSGQVSYETSALGHGIFTYYLKDSLDNANDANGDGVISMEECFSYISSGTRSYSGSYGPGYQYQPQISDGITGQAVLHPSIGSIFVDPINNSLRYSFNLYGHGFLKTLNITICSLYPTITFKTVDLKPYMISRTGFGLYSGVIELDQGFIAGGIQLFAEIEGNQLITLNLTFGDSDGDGLTDFFEIFNGNGLDPTLNDTDSDGLNDYDEFYGPTDPLNSDTDSDGLLDGEEVNIYGTDPILEDTDSDGLTDYEEVITYGTDPILADTDSDGLSDYEEVITYGTDPFLEDTDSDGLSDYEEVITYGTDPFLEDSDSDGLSDYEEIITYGTDPWLVDSDSDGLSDYEEVITYGTDPLLGDSDSDGLSDYDEVNIHNTNPLNSDSDSDGLSDYDEIITHGTDPLNPDMDSDGLTDGDEINIYFTNPLNNDTDSDNLLDYDEIFVHFTDPLSDDTDSDGLTDYDEIFIHNTDPLNDDTDSDGLSDYDEIIIHGTDPFDGDTDSDTMPDGWEVDNSLDPLTNDTALDPDNDFLTNIEEFQHGTLAMNNDTDSDGLLDGIEVFTYNTNPTIADTDSDGLLDGEEVNMYNTDPLDEDTDSDGLLDGEEVIVYNTDPLSVDTDSDTMPDKWEVDCSLNPLVDDTMLDPDSDDLVNIDEYYYGTDPQNPDSDYDGWTDGEEIEEGTDPLDGFDHPSPPSPPPGGIPGYHIVILLSLVGGISLVLVKKKKVRMV